MRYFHSSPKNLSHQLLPIIGTVTKEGVKGSTTYYVKAIETTIDRNLLSDSKVIMERYTDGLLLTFFKSDKRNFLAIPYHEISQLRLIKGKEYVAKRSLSIMRLLLICGVSLETARYFRQGISEYSIGETELLLATQDMKLYMLTNGYTFSGQKRFFSQLKGIQGLQIVE